MSTATLEGLCLRRQEVGEKDLILTFLTRPAGKLDVMAKGVRSARSRNAPACQMFVLSRLQLAHGRRLPVLAQVELVETFYGLREDLWRSAYAAYVCELTDRALPDAEPHEEVFELLVATLHGLLAADDGAAWVHAYELRLLTLLGYAPVLDRCARCGRPVTGGTALFCPAAGGLLHPGELEPREAAVEVGPRLVRALRRLVEPERYDLDLSATRIPADLAPALREAIRSYLRCHLETEPRSAAFLDQLRAL